MLKIFALLVLLGLSSSALAEDSASQSLFGFHAALAKEGNPDSMYMLGNLYERGAGVKRDYEKALRWYRLASENGNLIANRKIQRLTKKLAELKKHGPKTQTATRKPPSKIDASEEKAELANNVKSSSPLISSNANHSPSRAVVIQTDDSQEPANSLSIRAPSSKQKNLRAVSVNSNEDSATKLNAINVQSINRIGSGAAADSSMQLSASKGAARNQAQGGQAKEALATNDSGVGKLGEKASALAASEKTPPANDRDTQNGFVSNP